MQTSNQPDDELPDHGLCKSTKRSVSKTTDEAARRTSSSSAGSGEEVEEEAMV